MNETNLSPHAPVHHALDNLLMSVKDNLTLPEAAPHAPHRTLDNVLDNLATREALRRFAQCVIESLPEQDQSFPTIDESLQCSFCNAREVIKHYNPAQMKNWTHSDAGSLDTEDSRVLAACATCATCIETGLMDQLGERTLVSYFHAHPKYPKTDETEKLVRQDIFISPARYWKLRKPQDSHQNRKVVTKDTDICEKLSCLGDADVIQAQEPSPQKRPSATKINEYRTVLLVGDDKGVTKMLKERFEHALFVVHSACDIENGVRLYESSGPFLLVMIDFNLPNSGVELVRIIRQNDPLQKIVIAAHDYENKAEVPRPKELMDIPILPDIRKLGDVLDKLRDWAGRDDVVQAINTLGDEDLLRIQKIAKLKQWGRRADDWKELLQDALMKTLIGADDPSSGKRKGKRRWDKGIDFVEHLTDVMSSDVYHSRKKSNKQKTYGESELKKLISENTSPDECLIQSEERAQKEAEILQLFSADQEATNVLQDLFCNLDKDEITWKRSLSSKQYAAIMKRIRFKIVCRNNNGEGEDHDT
jgi:CheY-like chemotaxis protein